MRQSSAGAGHPLPLTKRLALDSSSQAITKAVGAQANWIGSGSTSTIPILLIRFGKSFSVKLSAAHSKAM